MVQNIQYIEENTHKNTKQQINLNRRNLINERMNKQWYYNNGQQSLTIANNYFRKTVLKIGNTLCVSDITNFLQHGSTDPM